MGNNKTIDNLQKEGIEVRLVQDVQDISGGWVKIIKREATLIIDGEEHIIKYELQSKHNPIDTSNNYNNRLTINNFGSIKSNKIKNILEQYLSQVPTSE
jgi:hypothetical protein